MTCCISNPVAILAAPSTWDRVLHCPSCIAMTILHMSSDKAILCTASAILWIHHQNGLQSRRFSVASVKILGRSEWKEVRVKLFSRRKEEARVLWIVSSIEATESFLWCFGIQTFLESRRKHSWTCWFLLKFWTTQWQPVMMYKIIKLDDVLWICLDLGTIKWLSE